MSEQIKKFLQFNGKNIYFTFINNQWWVAIKPICEALGVNFERQRQNISDDAFLSQLPTIQQVVAADGKLRKMICLPEFYLYGWLFKINSSDNPLLKDYQWKCYEILYNHFHGYMGLRNNILSKRAELQIKMAKAKLKLKQTPEYHEMAELAKENQEAAKMLKEIDEMVVTQQLSLFDQN